MMKNKFSVRLIARLYRLFRRRPPKSIERILIVSTTGLGDTLWSLPATLSLRKSLPRAKLFFLTGPFGKELFKNSGVDQIIEVPKARGLTRLKLLPKLYQQLRALRVDTILFFHVQPTYALITFLTGAKTYGNPEKVPPAALTHPFPFTHETEHLISHRLRMIEAIGAKVHVNSLFLETDKQQTEELKLQGSPVIGLCIGSQDAYKIWPARQFGRLAEKLSREFGARVVLIGSAAEKPLAKQVQEIFPHALDYTGRFSIDELIHFIDGLDLLISNDTGPAHIAYAVATPAVTLFSPTSAEQNGPYNARGFAAVVSQPVTCTPCVSTRCLAPFCMRAIGVDAVFAKVEAFFSQWLTN